MALNWNIEKCDNYKELTEGEPWQITNALIWGTMAIGMREITAKNYKEFYQRVNLMEKLNGTWLSRHDTETQKVESLFITEDDVKRRIGLRTNAGTIPRQTFIKRAAKYQFEA